MGEGLISVQFLFRFIFLSSHYPPLCLALPPKGLSYTYSLIAGCLQSLESAAVMSMGRHFGHVIWEIWVSGFLCPSGCSAGAAPHFLCRCTLIYPYETFFPLLNPITWFCAELLCRPSLSCPLKFSPEGPYGDCTAETLRYAWL